MDFTGVNLPPPTETGRQVGLSTSGSPLLQRSVSTGSDISIRSPPPRQVSADDTIRERLLTYKENLEHEKDFVDSEIQALINRAPSEDQQIQRELLLLRDDLKVRFNNITLKLSRVLSLLEVL